MNDEAILRQMLELSTHLSSRIHRETLIDALCEALEFHTADMNNKYDIVVIRDTFDPENIQFEDLDL